MRLQGSCHCRRVRFELECPTPWPYQRCYCSVCRKTAGGGGYCINLGGTSASLQVTGREHVRVYRAEIVQSGVPQQSQHERHFCVCCGSHLWAYHPAWPELVHPVAGAIDTPLPPAPAHVHLMLASKPAWVPCAPGPGDEEYPEYPASSLEAWHAAHGYRADG